MDMDFYGLQENMKNNYWIKDWMLPKKQQGEYLGNKIADTVTQLNDVNIEKQEPVEEIIIPPEKREEILSKLRKVL